MGSSVYVCKMPKQRQPISTILCLRTRKRIRYALQTRVLRSRLRNMLRKKTRGGVRTVYFPHWNCIHCLESHQPNLLNVVQWVPKRTMRVVRPLSMCYWFWSDKLDESESPCAPTRWWCSQSAPPTYSQLEQLMRNWLKRFFSLSSDWNQLA